jgi:DNA-binding NtrC family response regulator
MKKKVVVLDPDDSHCHTLSTILRIEGYQVFVQETLKKMEMCIHANDCSVAMIDIDAVAVDNLTIRELTVKYPGVYFLCLSEDRFHPELREALGRHIYACINKPVDPGEIRFWLRSIFCDHPA